MLARIKYLIPCRQTLVSRHVLSENPIQPNTTQPVERRSSWIRERYAELSAWLTSLALHIGALVLLGTVTLLTPLDQVTLMLSSPVIDEPDETPPDTFRVSEELSVEVGALAENGIGDAAAEASLDALVDNVALDLQSMTELGELPAIDLPTNMVASPELKNQIMVRGVGAVGTAGSSGAVDRLTGEILLSLEQNPTLVVWLFDRSASLRDQRAEIVERFDRVYQELGVISDQGAPQFSDHIFDEGDEEPLLTSIAAFGTDVEFFGDKPSADVEELKSSISSIQEEESGQENVFSAIIKAAQQHKRYRLRKPRRHVMIVVVTDEAGDDLNQLDKAVDTCRKLRMPVYIVGTPAPFGRQEAFVRYVDPNPEYDQTPQYLPVRQGPESLYPERLRLGSIGRGDFDGPTLDSGFGPYALTRLPNETGGFYIAVHPFRVESGRANRRGPTGMTSQIDYFFDQRIMRRYRPDYVPTKEYEKRLAKNQAMAALVRAASQTWTEPLTNVRREFPKLNEADFTNALSRAQQSAALIEPQLGQVVAILRKGEKDRDELTTPRWQAGYDLAMGRALAAKVRAEGYNATLAQAKSGLTFTNDKNDTWILSSTDKITTGSAAEAEAKLAKKYLQRVIEEHEGTPWAYLAERELKQPLGWEWKDTFRNLIARAEQNNNQRRERRETPEPKRRPPPKL